MVDSLSLLSCLLSFFLDAAALCFFRSTFLFYVVTLLCLQSVFRSCRKNHFGKVKEKIMFRLTWFCRR